MRLHPYPSLLVIIALIHGLILYQRYQISSPKKVSGAPEEKTKILKVKIDRIKIVETKRQIVQSDDSVDESIVDGAYLSDKNRHFSRQTRARKIDTFKSASAGSLGGGAKKGSKELKLSDLSGLAPGDHPFREAAKLAQEGKAHRQMAGLGHKLEGDLISSTNDHLEDIPLGDMTYLNTVEYKYYGFYHRIRQKLEQFWGRSIQEKAEAMMKSGRRIAASDDLVTALIITLDTAGEIIAIKVKGSSGIRELDDAAIESFNEAGPFPNPPQGLIVDGKVTLEWGFVVKT